MLPIVVVSSEPLVATVVNENLHAPPCADGVLQMGVDTTDRPRAVVTSAVSSGEEYFDRGTRTHMGFLRLTAGRQNEEFVSSLTVDIGQKILSVQSKPGA